MAKFYYQRTTLGKLYGVISDTHPNTKRAEGKPPPFQNCHELKGEQLDWTLDQCNAHFAPKISEGGTPILEQQT
ncbi:MAG: hypothetical protein F6K48_20700 [Okeania sp. SIO3H1]|nr:hypothetical protein [Okeania sp. SIO3H1]